MPVSLRSIMSAERLSEGKFALRRSKRFWRVNWTIKGERIWHLGQTGFNRLLKELRKVERCWWWDVWPAAEFKNWVLNVFSFSMRRKCVRLIVVTQYEYAYLQAYLLMYIQIQFKKCKYCVFNLLLSFQNNYNGHFIHKAYAKTITTNPITLLFIGICMQSVDLANIHYFFWINTDAYDIRQFL